MFKYSVLRLALFVGAMGVLYLCGARGLLNLLLAAVISMLLSYLLLRGLRDEVSRAIAGQIEARLPPSGPRTLGLDDDSTAEDAAVDAADAVVREPDPS